MGYGMSGRAWHSVRQRLSPSFNDWKPIPGPGRSYAISLRQTLLDICVTIVRSCLGDEPKS
jgi:hypothetical protein